MANPPRMVPHPPEFFANHTNGFHDLPHPFEEEDSPYFFRERYYSIRIGDVLNERYQVHTKLGYGRHSVTWLCQDLLNHSYVAVKVHSSHPNSETEISAYADLECEAFATLQSAIDKLNPHRHEGVSHVRRCLDSFKIVWKPRSLESFEKFRGGKTLAKSANIEPFSAHQCFVFKPLGLSLANWRDMRPQRRLRVQDVKFLTFHLLLAIDFVHRKMRITHGDIREENIMLEFLDPNAPRGIADLAAVHPTKCKLVASKRGKEKGKKEGKKKKVPHIIYQSRTDLVHNFAGKRPVLCDFDSIPKQVEMNEGEGSQELAYRAPEVLFGHLWGRKVDIWALGLLVWELIEGTPLFPKGLSNACVQPHLARMIQILGAPPLTLKMKLKVNPDERYFTNAGQPSPGLAALVEQYETDLGQEERVLEGQEKHQFLQFIKPLLSWDPAQRPTARQLIESAWLAPHNNGDIRRFNLDLPSEEEPLLEL